MEDDNSSPPQENQPDVTPATPKPLRKQKPILPQRKASLRVDSVFYGQLVEAYRLTPNNHHRVRKTLGCDWNTAKKAWAKGWPQFGFRPIKELLEEEQRICRGRRFEKEAEEKLAAADVAIAAKLEQADVHAAERIKAAEREAKQRIADLLSKAKIDSAETMADEAIIGKSARKVALGLHGIAAHILKRENVPIIADAVVKALEGSKLTPSEAAHMLRALSGFGKDIVELDNGVLNYERKKAGQPIEVIKVEIEQMTTKEALNTIDEAKALADLVRAEMVDGALVEDADNGANGRGNGSVH